MIGKTLGHYQITEKLGAGGMGEVYKGRDTRLDRIVALKILSPGASPGADLRQRFEREARAVAALNHPHICTLFDVGRDGDTDFLVMEYCEGETLAQRLSKGPLPLEQALRHGTEIADALDKAHRAGIVHRDLKPGNIMITRSGVKLLDFGLAKLRPLSAATGELLTKATATEPLTAAGTILGTLHYMAPEQLEGKDADARSDLFAFGAVLYEMLTGKRAFEGTSQASVITAIMSAQPSSISAVQPMTPPALDRLVRTCLEKDADERWQSAHDVAAELRWIATAGRAPGEELKTPPPGRTLLWLGWGLAALFGLLGLLLAFRSTQTKPREDALAVRSVIMPAAGSSINVFMPQVGLALSPDGNNLAYVGSSPDGKSQLWLRPLDSLTARPLEGTEGASWPFWSPDGTQIGFFADSKLKIIHAAGGSTRMLTDTGQFPQGGSWGPDGAIVFNREWTGPLFRVSRAGGGSITPATKLDTSAKELSHCYPFLLPGGRAMLYQAMTYTRILGIYATSLDDRPGRLLLPDATVAAAAAGHLVFDRGAALFAQKFDADSLTLTGQPIQIARDVIRTAGSTYFTMTLFSVAGDRALVYVEFGGELGFRLQRFDRAGKLIDSFPSPVLFSNFVLSPDGLEVAFDEYDPGTNAREIQVLNLGHGTRNRLPVASGRQASDPVWSRDGTRLLFCLLSDSGSELVERTIGADAGSVILKSDHLIYPRDWSRDGRIVLYDSYETGMSNIWVLPLFADRKPVPFRRSPASEMGAQFSPDDRFVAFTSNTSGRDEVYVAPFGSSGSTQIVSSAGGRAARWRRDGKELFYLSIADELMAVDVRSAGDGLEFSTPRRLFQAHPMWQGWSPYVVSPDGQTFRIYSLPEETPARIVLIQNWTALLPR